MPTSVNYRIAICRFESIGLWRRAYNAVEAIFRQGDVNHITGDVSYIACLLNSKKTIVTIPDCGQMKLLQGWRRWVFKLVWLRLPAQRSAVVTTISEFSKKELIEHIECLSSKIQVIGVPLDPHFGPMDATFDDKHPTILQIGTLPNKNLERVIEALSGITCHLRIVGKLSSTQIQLLRESKVEYSNGYLLSDAEMVKEYEKCDMVVFTSNYEGFGVPIIEANAIGRPVITSNMSPMSDVAGDAACLVDPYDVLSIRRGILRVTSEPVYRETLIRRGYCNAERFSATAIAKEYGEVYARLYEQG